MPTSANCPKNPSDVRADVGIRAPILPLSQQLYLPRRMSRPEGIFVAGCSGVALNSCPGDNSLPSRVINLPSRTKTSST